MITNNFKAIILAISLTAGSVITAQADTLALTADTNPSPFAEQFQFSSNPVQGENFSDIVNLIITPTRNLVASISGTSGSGINLSTFDLYSGTSSGANTLVQTGDVISPLVNLTSGSLTDVNLAGNYFIKIEGTQFGTSSYNGNISLTSVSAVPEPETYAMLLSGLALIGFAGRRRKIG